MINPGTKYRDLFAALAAPFVGDQVRSRQVGNRQASYVTARTVMNRLDDVVGPENWRDEYAPLANGVLCTLSIRIPDGEWVAKSDAGGNAGMSDEGDDEKSGHSDAFKRAAVKWGVGRHLYGEGVPSYGQDAGGTPAPQGTPARRDAGHDRGRDPRPDGRIETNGPPRTGKEFWGWYQKQPKEVRDRADAIRDSWKLPARYIDLNREEVKAIYNELTMKVHGGFGNSNGNGRR